MLCYGYDVFCFFDRSIGTDGFVTRSTIGHATAYIVAASHFLKRSRQSGLRCSHLPIDTDLAFAGSPRECRASCLSQSAVQTVGFVSIIQLVRGSCRKGSSRDRIHLLDSAQLVHLHIASSLQTSSPKQHAAHQSLVELLIVLQFPLDSIQVVHQRSRLR